MNKESVKKQVAKIHLNTKEEILVQLEKESEMFLKQIQLLKSINVDGVEPMTRINNEPISFLREDVEGETFAREKILANAPEAKGNFVALKKVVGND